MNLNSLKLQKVVIMTVVVLAGALLSACTTVGGENVGVGGLGGDESTPGGVEAQPNSDATEVPTEAPIPDTYGHIIFISNRDGQMSLYKSTPDGVEQIRLTTTADADDSSPQISPDGSKVAFVSTVNNNTDIYVLDITSGFINRITDADGKDSAPSWSRDSSRIAFESFRDGNLEIYMANVDGSNTVRLTDDPAGDTNPVWSPVSDEIAFVSNRFGNSDILILSTSGGISPLTNNSAPDSAPAWSPDGSMLAFKKSADILADICVIGRDGLNQRCITNGPSEYGAPVWSHNSEQFAVNARTSTGFGINVFNIASGEVTQLAFPGVDPKGNPAWSPEDMRLVFQAQAEGDMEIYSVLIPKNEFTRLTSTPAYDGEPVWSSQ